ARLVAEGRVRPHGDRRRKLGPHRHGANLVAQPLVGQLRLVRQDLQVTGVYPIGRQRVDIREVQDRGREPQRPTTPACAVGHHAFHAERTAQRLRRGRHIPLGDALPDPGGTDRVVVFRKQRNHIHREVPVLGDLPERVGGTGGLVTEGEVLPHYDVLGPQRIEQRPVNVFLWGPGGNLRGEGLGNNVVDPEIHRQLRALLHRAQQLRNR